MGLVHRETGAPWGWYIEFMGLVHRAGTPWDWDTKRLVRNGTPRVNRETGIQWGWQWYTKKLVHSGAGTQTDWY